MLNQSFSADNFQEVFDRENRKGVYLERKFFPKIAKITNHIYKLNQALKNLKKDTKEDENLAEKNAISEQIDKLKDEKQEELTKELENISAKITKKGFKITLKEIDLSKKPESADKTKIVSYYSTEKCAASYFAFKQVQYNIKNLYKVKQSDRYKIMCQLKEMLSDKFPKYIIRTDIKDFFESIPRDKLKKKINDDYLLTLLSKNIITQTLEQYTECSKNKNGIPRGIGISSYLSELYMRDIDEQIRSQENVLFYARYVDDIIIIYAGKKDSDNSVLNGYKTKLEEIVKNAGLEINTAKTKVLNLTKKCDTKLAYLGYEMTLNSGKIIFKLTKKKIATYIKRIEESFKAYEKDKALNEKKARNMLFKRINFLTGNTRLLNNKKHILVGIYFSNSLLSSPLTLNCLDQYLLSKINKIESEMLQKRLNTISFQAGFEQKRFSRFSAIELQELAKVWKYAS